MLKSLDEKITKGGLFKEVGTTGGGVTVSPQAGQTEAEAKIEIIAKGIVEKSVDGKKLTSAQARSQAWQANPELYRQHEAELAPR